MFEIIYLDRRASYYFYISMIFILNVIYYLFLGLFIYSMWQERHAFLDLFNVAHLNQAHQNQNWQEYIDFGKKWVIDFLYLCLNLFIVYLLIEGLKICKIPNTWLRKWDEDEQIDTVFGRFLVEHIRYHRKINFKDFTYWHKMAINERYSLYKVSKDKNLTHLFNKFDINYTKDINNP